MVDASTGRGSTETSGVDEHGTVTTGRPWWQLGGRAGGIVVAAVLVLGVAAFGLVRSVTNPSLCDALAARPADMPRIEWDNGITSSQATWYTVLSSGVQYGDEPTRRAMAAVVGEDEAGFEAVLERMPAEERAALERLGALALDPVAGRSQAADPATEADIRVLVDRKVAADCPWA